MFKRGQTMTAHIELQLDALHCRAICEEIGERLRVMLDREVTAMPPRLQSLLLRLAAQELAASPSFDGTMRTDPAKNLNAPIRAA
jgi:hypothetical protein